MVQLNAAERWKDNLAQSIFQYVFPAAHMLAEFRRGMAENIGQMTQPLDQIKEHLVIPNTGTMFPEEFATLTLFLEGVMEAGIARRAEVLAEREAARLEAERRAQEEAAREEARRQKAEDERWAAHEAQQADYAAWKARQKGRIPVA